MSPAPPTEGAPCPKCGTWRNPSPLACFCGYSERAAREGAHLSLSLALGAWFFWLVGGAASFYLLGLGMIFGVPMILIGLGMAIYAVRLGLLALRSPGSLRVFGAVGLALAGVIVAAPIALIVFSIVRATLG